MSAYSATCLSLPSCSAAVAVARPNCNTHQSQHSHSRQRDVRCLSSCVCIAPVRQHDNQSGSSGDPRFVSFLLLSFSSQCAGAAPSCWYQRISADPHCKRQSGTASCMAVTNCLGFVADAVQCLVQVHCTCSDQPQRPAYSDIWNAQPVVEFVLFCNAAQVSSVQCHHQPSQQYQQDECCHKSN